VREVKKIGKREGEKRSRRSEMKHRMKLVERRKKALETNIAKRRRKNLWSSIRESPFSPVRFRLLIVSVPF